LVLLRRQRDWRGHQSWEKGIGLQVFEASTGLSGASAFYDYGHFSAFDTC